MSIRINCFLDAKGNKIYPGDSTGSNNSQFKILDVYYGFIFIYFTDYIYIRNQPLFIMKKHELFKRGETNKEKIILFRRYINNQSVFENIKKFGVLSKHPEVIYRRREVWDFL